MLDIIVSDFAENLNKRELQNDEILRIMDEDSHFLSEMESLRQGSDISARSDKSRLKQATIHKEMPLESVYPIKHKQPEKKD